MEIVKMRNIDQALKVAVEVLKNGGLVVFPSDTVYGLAVDATNQKAVNKLLAFKERWPGKAISVAVADKKMAGNYIKMTDKVADIFDNLLPGPFTVVADGKHNLATGIEAENGSLGVRLTDNELMCKLAKALGRPFTATSANLSGRRPHYSLKSFLATLSERKKEMIDLVIDGDKLPRNKPSTVIDVTETEIKVLRRGDLVTGKKGLISKSERETQKIAQFLWKKHGDKKRLVFGLTGDLGTGKTVFARGMAKALGIKGKVTSPTFTILNEYKISCKLQVASGKFDRFLHFDLYKVESEEELKELKFLKLFGPGTVACIEWPENMGERYFCRLKNKVNYVGIGFEYVDQDTREIRGI